METDAELEKLYNALLEFYDAVFLAEYVSKNPSLSEMRDLLASAKENKAQKLQSPYEKRWVTDNLEFGHKSYKKAS